MPAPSDFVPDGAKPADFVPDIATKSLKKLGKPLQPDRPTGSIMGNIGAAEIEKGKAEQQVDIPSALSGTLPIAGAEAGGAAAARLGLGRFGTAVARSLGTALASAPTDPHQPAKQAGWTFGLSMLGEGIAAPFGGFQKEAGAMAKAAPTIGEATPSKIRSLSQIRQMLQSAGKTPEEIDNYLGAAKEAAGTQTRNAYNAVLRNTEKQFNTDYDQVLSKYAGRKIDATPIHQAIQEQVQELARRGTQDQESAALKRFLETSVPMRTDIKPFTLDTGEIVVPGRPTTTAPELGNTMSKVTGQVPDQMTIDEMRGLRGRLRGLRTPTTSNTTHEVSNKIEGVVTKTMKSAMSPEDGAAMDAVDARYGTFQSVKNSFWDMRSVRFAHAAANQLFDKGTSKNYEDLDHLFTLAKSANEVNPEIMPAFKSAFLTKLFGDARAKAPANLDEQKAIIGEMTSTFRGKVPEVMRQMFGEGTPFSDIREFTRIMGKAAAPETETATAGFLKKLATRPAQAGGFLLSGYFLWRIEYGLAFGSSPWTDLQKNSGRFAEGMALALGTGTIAAAIITRGTPAMQRAWARAMIAPTDANLSRMFEMTAPVAAQLIDKQGAAQSQQQQPPR